MGQDVFVRRYLAFMVDIQKMIDRRSRARLVMM